MSKEHLTPLKIQISNVPKITETDDKELSVIIQQENIQPEQLETENLNIKPVEKLTEKDGESVIVSPGKAVRAKNDLEVVSFYQLGFVGFLA